MSIPRVDLPRTCPDALALRKWVQDELSGEDAAPIEEHVGTCPFCQRALDQLGGSLPGLLYPSPERRDQVEDEEPPCLDGYELPSRIAEGGMGVVWRIRDPQFDRPLAVKVMKQRGLRIEGWVPRFLREARISGSLVHPYIVPVHAMGRLPDGRPYYTMKLVVGDTLAARLRDRAYRTAHQADLLLAFSQVCQAVAYAHERGIIHRDLKPENVMVGVNDEVQVMDWGLTKDLADAGPSETSPGASWPGGDVASPGPGPDQGTQAGSVLGSLPYMSPESANGHVSEVDRRSDVFGLGAILCEILTGEPPYPVSDLASLNRRATVADLDDARARLCVCGAEPDLVGLALKCLAPAKADRPKDAGEVASAMKRYFAGVQERLQEERLERERREVRAAEVGRRRRLLVVAASCVLLVLALGAVASTFFWLAERSAHKIATHEAVMEEEATWLLEYVFSLADPSSEPNRTISLREAVDRTTEKLVSGGLKEHVKTPESNARARITLGKVYFNLGAYAQSRDLFADAHGIAREALGETHPTAMTALDQLGKAHLSLEEFSEAERVLLEAYRLQRKALGPEDEDTVHTYAKLADLYQVMGQLEKALEIERDVLAVRRRLWGEEYEFTLVSMNGLGMLYLDLGRPAEALPLFSEAELVARRTLGENHPSTLIYINNHALALSHLGRRKEALALFFECLATKRTVLPKDHLGTLQTEQNIAGVLLDDGDYAGARDRLESVLKRMEGQVGKDSIPRGVVLVKLGRCLAGLGRRDDAERTLREAQALLLKKLGPAHKYTLGAAKVLEELHGQDPGPSGGPPVPGAAPRG